MNFLKKTVLILLVALAIFSGCKKTSDSDDGGIGALGGGGDGGGTTDGGDEVEIDWGDHSPYSVQIRNNTNQDLVVFKGEIAANSLIGGVKATSTTKMEKKG